MISGKRLWAKLRNFLNHSRAEEELARELASHIALLEDEFQQRGFGTEEARLAARRACGGLEQAKELHRAERSFWKLEQLCQDFRFATRILHKHPGFACTSVLTLALGLGASTAIFTLIQSTVLKPLPYRDPSRLVRIIENVPATESLTGKAIRLPALSQEDARELRQHSKTLSDLALYLPGTMVLTGPVAAQVVSVTQVSPQLLPLLGRQPLLGRAFWTDEMKAGTDHRVLLSYKAWVQYFGGASNVLEQSIILDDVRYSIAGVMPPNFAFPDPQTAFWRPLLPVKTNTGQLLVFPVLARINPQFSLSVASTEVNQVFRRMRGDEQLASRNSGLPRIELQTLRDAQSAISRSALAVLAVAVGFLLLIACANVSNLLLARLASRQREMATRAALGAGWGRLIRQSFTESVFLASCGGLLGVPVAVAVSRWLFLHWPGNVNGAGAIPQLEHLSFDISAALFTVGLSLIAGLMLGAAPAFHLSRTDHMESLKKGPVRAFSVWRTYGKGHGLGTLVIVETGLAFVLLIGASLLSRSFLKLSRVDPGFNTKGILTFQVASSPSTSRQRFNLELAERLQALPGVQAAGYGELLPFELDSMLIRPLKVEGTASKNRRQAIQPRTLEGSWNYLPAVGMRLLRGRWFQERDGPGQRQVTLVNQAFAHYYFGDRNPLGRTVFSLGSAPWEIIGVVEDVRQQGLTSQPEPQFFLEYRQMQHANPGWNTGLDRLYSTHMYFAVRTTGDPFSLVPSIRQIIMQLDKNAVMNYTLRLEQVVTNTIAAPAFYAVLVDLFSFVAVALAALGLYGVIAYAVSQRTREIGIRIALGSSRPQVLRLVLGQGARLAAIGILIGLAGSVMVTRGLENLLFGVTPLDPPTFLAVSCLFATVAIIASYIPARRATRVDPALSLRDE